jgi:uncharacterized OB-fold protein
MQAIHPEADFQRFLSEGRCMIQRCSSSARYSLCLRVAEPVTVNTDLEWVEASGQGTVYSRNCNG